MSDERPCRCGPGVVHDPLPPDWLEQQVAKAADLLAKEVDAQALREAYAQVYRRVKW